MNPMTHIDIYTRFFLSFLFLKVVAQAYLDLRNKKSILKNFSHLPPQYQDQITEEEYLKANRYSLEKIKVAKVFRSINLIILLVWTVGGGIHYLGNLSLSLFENQLTQSLFILYLFGLIDSIFQLPMSIYSTFFLEEKYGFNKTTPKVFALDLLKSTLLGLVIGTPIFIGIISIIHHLSSSWWIYGWIFMILFQVLLIWAYPTFIAPLFNKFTPLEDESLKSKIEELLQYAGLKSGGLFVMDASKRSTHGNAYFTGFGKNKRIVFFDTLLDKLSHGETLSVLAHELGHFKKKHILKGFTLSAISLFFIFYLLKLCIESPAFLKGHGLETNQTAAILILFSLILPIYSFFLSPFRNYFSRKNEFEADEYAAKATSPEDLISGLKKLYKYNYENLNPDELYSTFYHSHPPATQRINHLKSLKNHE